MSRFPAERILVPVDLSAASVPAWRWAKVLAAPGARLETLLVRESDPAPILGLSKARLTARERKALEARMRAAYPGSSPRVVEGSVAVEAARRAASADLVVTGSHGRHGLDRFMLGSVSEEIARLSPVPTLTVRVPPRRVRSVLAPVNLHPYSRKGLEAGARAAASLGAALTVLCVDEGGRGPEPRGYVCGLIASLPEELKKAVRPKLIVRRGEALKEILLEARRHGLVALTAHRRRLLTDLVLGTTAERVLRHSRTPVLSAPSGR
jgi:nucleotide-binding universal stress UspA family protein